MGKIINSNKKGFTLIEILFATAILAIGFVAICKIFFTTTEYINATRYESIAIQAAREEMETIRNMAFDEIIALSASFTTQGFSYLNAPTGTVTVDNPDGTADMRRVSLTVSWTSLRGDSKSTSLVTLVTRDGINKQ